MKLMPRKISKDGKRRLFFGFEVDTPDQIALAAGKLLAKKDRHITLAFLGEVDLEILLTHLNHFPKPDFTDGFMGIFSEVLFLPPPHPTSVAYKATFPGKERSIRMFQQRLVNWLKVLGFPPDEPEREWLPHVTFARKPFEFSPWRDAFQSCPFAVSKLHLYESMGDTKYEPRWTYSFKPVYEATIVRGRIFTEWFFHMKAALSMRHPQLWEFFQDSSEPRSHREAYQMINRGIAAANAKHGLGINALVIGENLISIDETDIESTFVSN